MKNLITNFDQYDCNICCNQYSSKETKRPRVLNCGHTFCESCLATFIKDCMPCPTCKVSIQYADVARIPVNYVLQSLCDEEKTEENNQSLPYEGKCVEHRSSRHFKCIDCKIFICGTCLTLSHKDCHTILVQELLQQCQFFLVKDISKLKVALKIERESIQRKVQALEVKQTQVKIGKKKYEDQLEIKNNLLKKFQDEIDQLLCQQLTISEQEQNTVKIEDSLKTTSSLKKINNAKTTVNLFMEELDKKYSDTDAEPVNHKVEDSSGISLKKNTEVRSVTAIFASPRNIRKFYQFRYWITTAIVEFGLTEPLLFSCITIFIFYSILSIIKCLLDATIFKEIPLI